MASSNKLKHRSRRVAMKRKRKPRALIVIGVAAFAVVFGGSYSALKNYVGKVKDDVICDNIYINEVLPAKMRYNLESMKHFGVQADASVLWDTFTSVVGSERMTIKK